MEMSDALYGVRQSRRLAQIKIKETLEVKQPESRKKDKAKEDKSKKKVPEKVSKVKIFTFIYTVIELIIAFQEITTSDKIKKVKKESPEPKVDQEEIKKKKRRERKKTKAPSKIFDEHRPWQSSSGSSEEEVEDEAEEEEVIEEDDPPLVFKSDHEFSPESDVCSDTEYQPLKRARTARKTEKEGKKLDLG